MKWFIQYFVFLSEIWKNFFLIEVPILARFKATLKGPLSLQDDETAHQIVTHIFNIWKMVRKTPTFFVGDLLDEEKIFKDWFNLAMEQLKASTVKAHMTSLGDFLAFCVKADLPTERKPEHLHRMIQMLRDARKSLRKKIAQHRTEVEADALGLCFFENHWKAYIMIVGS